MREYHEIQTTCPNCNHTFGLGRDISRAVTLYGSERSPFPDIETRAFAAPPQVREPKTDKMEHRNYPVEIRSVEGRTISGYAAVFDKEVEAYAEVVKRGAFTKTIAERGNKIPLLWQHDWNVPIGRFTMLREDHYGLYFEAVVSDTPKGNEALTLIKDGVIDGVSIGFEAVKGGTGHEQTDDGRTLRILREIKLWEASIVTFPAMEDATVTGVRQKPKTIADVIRAGEQDVDLTAMDLLGMLVELQETTETRAQEDAPNYREGDEEQRCGTCVNFQNGGCTLYEFSPDSSYVCDSYEARAEEEKEAGEEEASQPSDDTAGLNLNGVSMGEFVTGLSNAFRDQFSSDAGRWWEEHAAWVITEIFSDHIMVRYVGPSGASPFEWYRVGYKYSKGDYSFTPFKGWEGGAYVFVPGEHRAPGVDPEKAPEPEEREATVDVDKLAAILNIELSELRSGY